jgi:hypothetical protein
MVDKSPYHQQSAPKRRAHLISPAGSRAEFHDLRVCQELGESQKGVRRTRRRPLSLSWIFYLHRETLSTRFFHKPRKTNAI